MAQKFENTTELHFVYKTEKTRLLPSKTTHGHFGAVWHSCSKHFMGVKKEKKKTKTKKVKKKKREHQKKRYIAALQALEKFALLCGRKETPVRYGDMSKCQYVGVRKKVWLFMRRESRGMKGKWQAE